MLFIALIIASCILQINGQSPEFEIRIGALFENGTADEQRALRLAVKAINENKWSLPGAELSYINRTISVGDSLDVLPETCLLAREGIAALVTVASCVVDITVQEIGELLHVPTLQVGKSYCNFPRRDYFFTSLPDEKVILHGLSQFVWMQKYRFLVLLYETGADTSTLQRLLSAVSRDQNRMQLNTVLLEIPIAQGELLEGRRLQSVIKQLNSLLRRPKKPDALIVFAQPSVSVKFIAQVNRVNNINNAKIHWIVASPHIRANHLTELERNSHSYITVMRQSPKIVNQQVKQFVSDWNAELQRECGGKCASTNEVFVNDIPLSAYYVYDGLIHLSRALSRLLADRDYRTPAQLTCEPSSITEWKGGASLMSAISKVNSTGLLGLIELNKDGFQKHVHLEFLVKEPGDGEVFIKTVNWGSKNMTVDKIEEPAVALENKTFKVATVEEPPFVFVKRENGKKEFSGFSVDLMRSLSKNIGFQFEMYEVADRKYGTRQKDGTWNGLVGDVISGKADIAIAAMTITADREEVVDFTKRYMDYSVGIVMKKPEVTPNLFSFIEPFHPTVWFCILSALLLVAVLIFVLNQVSPTRSYNMDCNDAMSNQFTVVNVFWFVYSSLMQQGGELTTITIPVRIVTAFWWFFTLIVVSSYTANLAAFLTVNRMDTPIDNYKDLANQKITQYGTVRDTSIYDHVMKKGESDEDSMYGKMSRMLEKSENRITTAKEGLKKVEEGNFAFLWDVAVIDYEVLRHKTCSLMTVTDTIYDKGYGIALKQESVYRNSLSLGILQLQDSGEIEKLEKKWWPKSGKCSLGASSSSTRSSELNLENFSGVFCVLAAGLVLACLLAGCEILFHIKKGKAYPPNIPRRKTTIVVSDQMNKSIVRDIVGCKTVGSDLNVTHNPDEEILVVLKKSDLAQHLATNGDNKRKPSQEVVVTREPYISTAKAKELRKSLNSSSHLSEEKKMLVIKENENGHDNNVLSRNGSVSVLSNYNESQASNLGPPSYTGIESRPRLQSAPTNSLLSTEEEEKLHQRLHIHKLDPDDHFLTDQSTTESPQIAHPRFYSTYATPSRKKKVNRQYSEVNPSNVTMPRKHRTSYHIRRGDSVQYKSIPNLDAVYIHDRSFVPSSGTSFKKKFNTIQRVETKDQYSDRQRGCLSIPSCSYDPMGRTNIPGGDLKNWREPLISPEASTEGGERHLQTRDSFYKDRELPQSKDSNDNLLETAEEKKSNLFKKSCV